MKKLDAIIIGSGQGGNPLAKKLAAAGWKTALVEKRAAGGTCINDGCTPTKTLLASAKVAHVAAHSDEWGIVTNDISVDMDKVLARKNKIVESFRNGSEKGLTNTEHLSFIYGEASFSGPKKIKIVPDDGAEVELEADYIFINTGTKPSIPAIEGLEKAPYFTSTTILDLEVIPSHLIILGAGHVSLELAQLYKRLGSEVSVIEAAERILGKEDEDIAALIKNILQAEGIQFYEKATAKKITGTGKSIQIELRIGNKKQSITGTHLLIATGREPQAKLLQPKKSGIHINEKGYIEVNDKLETNVPGIYALGDVTGGPAFTHISYNDYSIIYKNLLENGNNTVDKRQVPYCMFTDPQLGRIGLTEQQASELGYAIQVAKLPMEKVARAIETGNTKGLMKVVVDRKTKLVLGAAIVGAQGGEVMSVLQMAMKGNITCDAMRDMVFAHPLYAEALNTLFATLQD